MLTCVFVPSIYIDINECHTLNGGCEQVCTNAVGTYVCSCNIGYTLNTNGYSCDGIL